MKVLIVEDDRDVAEMVKNGLSSASHTVEIASDGADGSFLARSYDYDAIVLDNSLPKKNGLTVCREIRTSGKTTPIVFLSVNGDENTKISAFEHGADDYMTKPFSIGELQARLRAVTRRAVDVRKPILTLHDLTVDVDKCLVIRSGKEINLTRKEFCLLEYFMRHPETVLSRAVLMEHVWTAESDPFSNTVEAHIRNLRNKLNFGNKKPNLIRNVPGRGYIIEPPISLPKRKN
jgi:two-component system OmpR family response regulator